MPWSRLQTVKITEHQRKRVKPVGSRWRSAKTGRKAAARVRIRSVTLRAGCKSAGCNGNRHCRIRPSRHIVKCSIRCKCLEVKTIASGGRFRKAGAAHKAGIGRSLRLDSPSAIWQHLLLIYAGCSHQVQKTGKSDCCRRDRAAGRPPASLPKCPPDGRMRRRVAQVKLDKHKFARGRMRP